MPNIVAPQFEGVAGLALGIVATPLVGPAAVFGGLAAGGYAGSIPKWRRPPEPGRPERSRRG